MSLGQIIKNIRNSKGYSLNDIREKTGLSKSSLSNIENDVNNPTIDTLDKISNALGVTTEYLIIKSKNEYYKEPTGKFTTATEAMKFILDQPVIRGSGGFDLNKLTERELLSFANDLLEQLEFLGYKYTKNKK